MISSNCYAELRNWLNKQFHNNVCMYVVKFNMVTWKYWSLLHANHIALTEDYSQYIHITVSTVCIWTWSNLSHLWL